MHHSESSVFGDRIIKIMAMIHMKDFYSEYDSGILIDHRILYSVPPSLLIFVILLVTALASSTVQRVWTFFDDRAIVYKLISIYTKAHPEMFISFALEPLNVPISFE